MKMWPKPIKRVNGDPDRQLRRAQRDLFGYTFARKIRKKKIVAAIERVMRERDQKQP